MATDGEQKHRTRAQPTGRWKVGELAARTGVSVRTLHYYEEIGLLVPSLRTPAGHRLYNDADVARLQQVRSLQQIGMSLDEVAECLRRRELSPADVIDAHLRRLRARIEMEEKLCSRLEMLAISMRAHQRISTERFLETLEAMTMYEKYYSAEQLATLDARRQSVGETRIAEVQSEWAVLKDAVRAEMDRGTDPADPRVQELARKWMALVREFTGGDAGIEKSLREMYQREPVVGGVETGPQRELMAYVHKCLAAAKTS